jgi:hypothetical protein
LRFPRRPLLRPSLLRVLQQLLMMQQPVLLHQQWLELQQV